MSSDSHELHSIAPPAKGSGRGVGHLLAGSMATGLAAQVELVVSGVVVARMLSVHDRGVVALAVVLPTLLVHLGTMGVPRAITFEAARPSGSARLALSAIMPLAILQAALIVLTAATVALILAANRGGVGLVTVIAVAYVPSAVTLQYALAGLQGLRSFRAFNAVRLLPTMLYAAVVLVILILSSGAASVAMVLIGWATAYALAALLAVLVVRKKLMTEYGQGDLHRDRPSIARLLRLGIRSLLGSLSPLGSMGTDQLIVGIVLSPTMLGLYVVASALCNAPRFLAQSAGMVAYPHVASLSPLSQSRAMLRIVLISTCIGGIAVTALILAADTIVPMFFGSAYAEAVPIARVLLIAAFLFGIRRVVSDSLQGTGRPMNGAIAEAAGWLTLAALLVLQWDSLDATGFATIVASAASVSLVTIIVTGKRAGAISDSNAARNAEL